MQIYESYVCDFCGKEFDDRDECERHEFFCEIKALEKEQNTKIRMYYRTGDLAPLDENLEVDGVAAIYVSDVDAIRMVKHWYDWKGYCHPWDNTAWRKNAIKEKSGLIVYDEDAEQWYYPVDKMKELQEVLKRFSDRG